MILGVRTMVGEEAFADWGWRLPFLLSIVLLGVSVWIRLSLNESPVFQKMKNGVASASEIAVMMLALGPSIFSTWVMKNRA